MFKDWIKDLWNFSMDTSDDVNIDIARANYQKHQDDLKRNQNDYIKTLCRKIKAAARDGRKYIETLHAFDEDFMTTEFIYEMKEYFEQRGFDAKIETYHYGIDYPWLKISWHEGDKQ
jgi:hypothetical protein